MLGHLHGLLEVLLWTHLRWTRRTSLVSYLHCHGHPNLQLPPDQSAASDTTARPSTNKRQHLTEGSDDGERFLTIKYTLIMIRTLLFWTKCYCTLNTVKWKHDSYMHWETRKLRALIHGETHFIAAVWNPSPQYVREMGVRTCMAPSVSVSVL